MQKQHDNKMKVVHMTSRPYFHTVALWAVNLLNHLVSENRLFCERIIQTSFVEWID